MDLTQYGKVPQIMFWLQKKLSNRVDKIIANSNASIEFHKKKGFFMDRAIVIPNGTDTNRFKRDEQIRDKLRKRYDLKESDIAIGIVARIDYMKGYTVFSQAAKKILSEYKNMKFFSIGGGDENIKKECDEILGSFNNERFIWLGSLENVHEFYNVLDISSSFGEGFSNSIAEAMSCEVACVVTDIGDSNLIVGECGIVVEPNSVESLYNGLKSMINSDFKSLGKKSRERIVENFSIQNMVKKTEKEMYDLEK